MARGNGKPQMDQPAIDAEHELPASDETAEVKAVGMEPTAAPRVEISPREKELQELRAERDNLRDRLARMQAEFENARKRAAREQQEFRDFAMADTLKALLPVVDNFERALSTATPEHAPEKFRSGIELIYKQLRDTLEKLGVRAVPAEGEPFNPHVHEAVEIVDTSDAKDHHVLEELQRGYKLKERLLRPSMVKVARNPKH